MKSKLAALIATTIVLALGAHAQAGIEYSHASSAGAGTALGKTSKALGAANNRLAEKLGAAGNTATKNNATAKSTLVVPEKIAPAKNRPVAKADPPAVFILSNGERIESSKYFLSMDSLQVEQDGAPRIIPMSNVNVDATMAANRQRGLHVKIPTNKAQIMVSF